MADLKKLISEIGTDPNPLWILRELEELILDNGSMRTFLTSDNLLHKVDLGKLRLKPVRIFFLRSSTLEQIIPVLKVRCLVAGIKAEIQMGGFAQYQQEAFSFDSALYAFNPDIIILAIALDDLAPAFTRDFSGLSEEDIHAEFERVISTFKSILTTIRGRTNANVLVHNFRLPSYPNLGIYDYQISYSQFDLINELNSSLKKLARSFSGVYIFDYDALSARYGRQKWTEARMWHVARMEVNAHYIPYLANEYMRYIINLAGLTRKCLVLDLDGTLWGGILGEDGLSGIKLGTGYPGSAYVDFQYAILDLYNKGIILAICSKNNEEDVLEVFEKHPFMILKPKHFASMRINWKDKASNIREIVEELNIGMDSVVFLDDNPVEVAQIRQLYPQILSYKLPSRPEDYVEFLRNLPVFDTLTMTEEDKHRGEEYRQQAERRKLEVASSSLEDFYRNLDMRARIFPANDGSIPRIAQLTQRTNQFNLTTRRYTEQEIKSKMLDSSWRVYSLELEDRFGKSGLVGVGILKIENGEIWIDTLLMSCRVMGRTVENSFIYFLATEACKLGFERLMAEYLPTAKNKVVANLYSSLGFQLISVECEGNGRSVWCLDLADLKLSPSPYVPIIED